MANCIHCGARLMNDEIAIYKKLVSRLAEKFLCKRCLAQEFKCGIELIDDKIDQFKKMGCVLFTPENK